MTGSHPALALMSMKKQMSLFTNATCYAMCLYMSSLNVRNLNKSRTFSYFLFERKIYIFIGFFFLLLLADQCCCIAASQILMEQMNVFNIKKNEINNEKKS